MNSEKITRIYLDHSATTPLDPLVLEAMVPYMTTEFGNASSLHAFGRSAKVAIEHARETIAEAIHAHPSEIVFTAGGTESDNLAIVGMAHAMQRRGRHLVGNRVEHHAVIHAMEHLKEEGFDISYAECDTDGRVFPEAVVSCLRPDTILVSVMHVNNEVGTINPVADVATLTKKRDILLHVDGVQSLGKLPLDVHGMGIDLLSVSAHKLYGPKGVGALYVRKGLLPSPLFHGGSQERGQRAGTENVAGIVGFARAVELSVQQMETESIRLTRLRDAMWNDIQREIPGSHLNGCSRHRLPGHLNISFEGVNADEALVLMDLAGIAISTGSACTSGSVVVSHVLSGMHVNPSHVRGAIRITMGRSTTVKDIQIAVAELKKSVETIRKS